MSRQLEVDANKVIEKLLQQNQNLVMQNVMLQVQLDEVLKEPEKEPEKKKG